MTAPTSSRLGRVARDHYATTQSFVDATAQVAGDMWSQVDPDNIADSWARQVPELTAVVSGAQLGAAREADAYVGEALGAQDLSDEAVSTVDPAAFAGAASDGRGLVSLLTHPIVVALLTIADIRDVGRAMGAGRRNLDMIVRTQVADASRLADQTSLVAHPAATGYIRQTDGNPCARCLILAGRFYQWNRGFQRHPRCLPPGAVVSGPARLATTRRWFEGELRVIRTASGQELAVTSNHPVLTDRGWVPANLVQPGDHVVRSLLSQGAAPLIVPDERQVPARIEDLWRPDGMVTLRGVPTAPEDFHGDGGHGEVDVVLADGLLRDRALASLGQPPGEGFLTGGVVSADALQRLGVGDSLLEGALASSRCDVRADNLRRALLGRHARPVDPAGVRAAANWYAQGDEAAADHWSAYAVAAAEALLALSTEVRRRDLGIRQNVLSPRWDPPAGPLTVESRGAYAERGQDLLLRLAGQVALDRVVENRASQWTGHVYNLTSAEGWFAANGLIVSNCGCSHVPASSGIQVPDPRSIYDRMSRAERIRAGFSLGDISALDEGADIFQVVNARRGVFTAGGRRFTREGTTRRGFARRRLGRGTPRLTPDQIFADAASREHAQQLLYRHGYLVEAPRPVVLPARMPSGGRAAPGSPVQVRQLLVDAQSPEAVSRVLAAEYQRITGRTMLVELRGSVATAREHAEGVLRAVEQYPDIEIRAVRTGRTQRSAAYAETDRHGREIIFSDTWSSVARRDEYLGALAEDVRRGWHPSGTGSPVGVATHETGHLFDPDFPFVDRRIDALLTERGAVGDAFDRTVRDGISGYAAQSRREMVAEAFADVVENGARASDLSRSVIRVVGEGRTGSAPIPGPTFGRLPSMPDFAGLPVARLTALVREHGITVPTGIRKPALVKLVDDLDSGKSPTLARQQAVLSITDERRTAADALIRAAELGPTNTPRAFQHLGRVLRRDLPPDLQTAFRPLLDALDAADLARVQAAIPAVARSAKVRQIGGAAGEVKPFKRGEMEWIGDQRGDAVFVIRPGYAATVDGGSVTLRRAAVAPATPEQVAALPAKKAVKKAAVPAKKATAAKAAKKAVPKPPPVPERMTAPALRKELSAAGAPEELLAGVPQPVLARHVTTLRQTGDPLGAGRLRQDVIDRRRALAEALAEAAELLDSQASKTVLSSRAASRLRRVEELVKGWPQEAPLRSLVTAMQAGSPAAIRRAIATAERRGAVKRIGPTSGDVTTYDRKTMSPLAGEKIPDGAQVRVVRPGYEVDIAGERVVLMRPVVEIATGVDALPRVATTPTPTVAAKATNPGFGTTRNGPIYRTAPVVSTSARTGRVESRRWDPSMGPPPYGAFEENCTNVVLAWDMRMRGFDVQAAPLDILDRHGYAAGRTYAETDELLAAAYRTASGAPHGRSFAGQSWRSLDEIEREILRDWPEGGRGWMHVGKHVFNVIKRNGRMEFVEAQFDASATRIVTSLYRRKYGGAMDGGAKVVRLDDLVPAEGILQAVQVVQ